jgi:hypothetical protein
LALHRRDDSVMDVVSTPDGRVRPKGGTAMPEPTMGEMARWTFYQRFIAERTRDIDPRHVEAWMRLEHPTLDGLSRTAFTEAMYAALAAALDAGPEESETLAASFGL